MKQPKKTITIHYSGSYMDIKLFFDNENKALKNLKDYKKEHEKKFGKEKLIVNITVK